VIEASLYQDLEERYSAKPVSQADFFAPKELLGHREEALAHNFRDIDEGVPTDLRLSFMNQMSTM
jgi:hypothetical protein